NHFFPEFDKPHSFWLVKQSFCGSASPAVVVIYIETALVGNHLLDEPANNTKSKPVSGYITALVPDGQLFSIFLQFLKGARWAIWIESCFDEGIPIVVEDW